MMSRNDTHQPLHQQAPSEEATDAANAAKPAISHRYGTGHMNIPLKSQATASNGGNNNNLSATPTFSNLSSGWNPIHTGYGHVRGAGSKIATAGHHPVGQSHDVLGFNQRIVGTNSSIGNAGAPISASSISHTPLNIQMLHRTPQMNMAPSLSQIPKSTSTHQRQSMQQHPSVHNAISASGTSNYPTTNVRNYSPHGGLPRGNLTFQPHSLVGGLPMNRSNGGHMNIASIAPGSNIHVNNSKMISNSRKSLNSSGIGTINSNVTNTNNSRGTSTVLSRPPPLLSAFSGVDTSVSATTVGSKASSAEFTRGAMLQPLQPAAGTHSTHHLIGGPLQRGMVQSTVTGPNYNLVGSSGRLGYNPSVAREYFAGGGRPPKMPILSVAGGYDDKQIPASGVAVEERDFIGNTTTINVDGRGEATVFSHHGIPADMADLTEIAVTTGLVTLSIHEPLTFDGVELALHPEVFHSADSSGSGGKEDGVITTPGVPKGKKLIHQFLRPGDLVEIRVWCARPGVATGSSSAKAKSTSGSVMKTKVKAKGASSSLHSRHPSLATVSSSAGGIVPLSVLSPGMQSIRGGSNYSLSSSFATSPGSVSNNNMSPMITSVPSQMLYGEHLLETSDSRSGLFGEGIIQSHPLTKESPGTIASNISSAASTLLAGAASSLFRNLNQPPANAPSIPPTIGTIPTMPELSNGKKRSSVPISTDSTPLQGVISPMMSHSRDSSLATNSTMGVMHSRDSSLISNSSSWVNTLNNSASREEMAQSSPNTQNNDASILTLTMDPVDETGEKTCHPSNMQLPMRRDGSLMTSSIPPHPLASSQSSMGVTPSVEGSVSSATPTPSPSNPSSPKLHSMASSTPSNTPPKSSSAVAASSSSCLQRVPSVASISRPPPAPTNLKKEGSHATETKKTISDNLNQGKDSDLLPPPPSDSDGTASRDRRHHIATTSDSESFNNAEENTAGSGDSAPNPPNHSNHTRHASNPSNAVATSITIPSTNSSDTGVGQSTVAASHPPHRRHRTASSNLVPPSSLAPPLPPPLPPSSSTATPISTPTISKKGDLEEQLSNDHPPGDINCSNEKVEDVLEQLLKTHFVRVSFVMPISEETLTSIKSGARTQVSLLRRVADLYRITAYDTVTVTQIARSRRPYVHRSLEIDFLTVTMKDIFMSRGDMYNFQKQFLNSWVYEGKRLVYNGMRANAKVIRHGDHAIRSGIISEYTKMTFRSRSARIMWLIQLSAEMWDFASPYEAGGGQKNEPSCHIYFDKFITFVRRLFHKWKKLELSHSLSVVFFSRTYIRHHHGEEKGFSSFHPNATPKAQSAVHVDADGRFFEDHYKIVIENETKTDWESLIYRMKQEFVKYPKEVSWNLSTGNERIPSTASQGNILESINITLNLLHLHYIDRDLHRTGNSIVIITPGNGVFEIDKNLAGITKQRMMDNGIGSDMLSLGLPPLHVAPFFLYKERSSSSEEEIQGFDEWKTFFEVPHWMNLSFVCYDNDEEPMLYKDQHVDDVTKAVREHEVTEQTWFATDGFLQKQSIRPVEFESLPASTTNTPHYKHLISGRGFEDILQACRPRSRGEYGSGLPQPLASLLRKFSSDRSINNKQNDIDLDAHNQPLPHHGSQSCLEWGAMNFNDIVLKKVHNSRQAISQSPSSTGSLMSAGSLMLSSQPLSLSHLQSSLSLEGAGQSISSGEGDSHKAIRKTRQSDDSLKTLGADGKGSAFVRNIVQKEKARRFSEENALNLTAIEKVMLEHDMHTFSCNKLSNNVNTVELNEQNKRKMSLENGSAGIVSPKPEDNSSLFPLQSKSKSGIEAALAQYDSSKPNRDYEDGRTTGIADSFVVLTEENALRSSMAVSPLSIGVPFSLDKRNDGIRPSAIRLVAPDAIPRPNLNSFRLNSIADGLKSIDHQLHDSRHTTQTVPAKENRLGERRNSQPGDNTAISPTKINQGHVKSSIQKRHQSKMNSTRSGLTYSNIHGSHRHRRKPWVLNPFRQEDEDEVLSKRTHNRRRWSHVFPLGEVEFKRHAGPNWKSLCQPAILPITIDFHPSPQELEDKEKFKIKQYSVTLPPMNETNYKSHTELLDELVLQRIIQDYQIVPREIIQQQARIGEAGENILEHTLSMGHKIQRLSYNANSDSVDVIQYYANFAERENPQTYRYLLWSVLKQDYVSVAQTFTKYTSPYKWNELDMLISGDTITSIIEGMRFPRISFVIIPDKFTNQNEEIEYCNKFQRLVEYFCKLQPKDASHKINISVNTSSSASPQDSSRDERFIVDLRKHGNEKYEWMELVHDSNCDTRRTFRITLQWLVAIAGKVDQQAQLLQRRCAQYGLKLVGVPHYSCLRSVFLNPFAVPITIPVRKKAFVDIIENSLTSIFDFVYDGEHMSDPNEVDCLEGFDFVVNKYSIKKRKKFVPARQYLHRSGTLFARLLRDGRGCAIIIIYLNQRHNSGDNQSLMLARSVFNSVDQYIEEVCDVD